MQDVTRIFVSHHHSPEEDTFTFRLVDELKAAGADVWVDRDGIPSGSFVAKISEGLAGRQWLVLVMSPAALHSNWVRSEVEAALHEWNSGRMLGVIPLVMSACDEEDIPVLWRPWQRYYATTGYEHARDGLFHALGLISATTSTASAAPTTSSQGIPPSSEASSWSYLMSLGFTRTIKTSAEMLLPPFVSISAGRCALGTTRPEVQVFGHDVVFDAEYAAHDPNVQHEIEVDAFEMAQFPVTVAEFNRFLAYDAQRVNAADTSNRVSSTPHAKNKPSPHLPANWQEQKDYPALPVTGISWDDAIIYCAWLSVGSEYTYRLPTEAEWEKGARWGPRFRHARTFTWEGDWTDTNCNVPHQLEVIGAHPQAASAYGIQDMLGKIWQWTISKWRLYPLTAGALAADVQHIASRPPEANVPSHSADERRVVRGGSYAEARRAYKRTTIRQGFAPDYRADDLGFRLVRTKAGG